MLDIYVMIWHLKSLNLKTILRPSIVGGMPLKRTHVVPSLNFKCTPREPLADGLMFTTLVEIKFNEYKFN
jgi:hypothetical protein